MITYSELEKGLKDLKISKNTTEKILVYFGKEDEISKLNTIIYQERMLRKHKMVGLISKGTRGYTMLVWMHPIIELLSTTYNVSYEEVARMYVNIGMDLMVRGYAITKYKYYHDSILTRVDHILTTKRDPAPDKTLRLFKYYAKKTYEKYGVALDTLNTEDRYHLIKLREYINSRELKAKEHIDKIFDTYNKPFPLYVLYGVKEEKETKVEIKHSKLNRIING